jgi:hypothetical protein
MIKTFVIEVEQRDDLPDSKINVEYITEILEQGAWLDVICIYESEA